MRDSPSLKPKLATSMTDACDSTLRLAANETGLDETDFPAARPDTIDEVLAQDSYPE